MIIYKLTCPETNEVKYIGQTKNMVQRLNCHLYSIKTQNNKKDKWVRYLKEKKLKPLIDSIEICEDNIADERECFWIEFYKDTILNTQTGGKTNFHFINDIRGGEKNGFYNKKHSITTKELMMLPRKNSKQCCIDGIVYDTVKEASRKLNIHRNTIDSRINNTNFPNYQLID